MEDYGLDPLAPDAGYSQPASPSVYSPQVAPPEPGIVDLTKSYSQVPSRIDVNFGTDGDADYWRQAEESLAPRDKNRVLLHRLHTQARAQSQTVEQLKDVSVADIIRESRERSQRRLDTLMAKIEGIETRMRQPVPEQRGAQLPSEAEGIAALIATLIDPKSAGQIAGDTLKMTDERTALEDANKLMAWKQQQADAEREYQNMMRQIAGAENDIQQADQAEINYRIREREMKAAEAKEAARVAAQEGREDRREALTMRSRVFSDDNPAAIRYNARQLREMYPEYAPTDAEVATAIRAAAEKPLKALTAQIGSIWKNGMEISDADRFALEAARESLKNEYGLPDAQLPIIPDTKTLAARRQQLQVEQLQFAKDKWAEQLSWMKDKHAKDLEARYAAIEVMRFNASVSAARGDVYAANSYRSQADTASQKAIQEAQEKQRELKVEIAGHEAKKKGANAALVKQLNIAIAGAQAKIDAWQKIIDEHNNQRAANGEMPVAPPSMPQPNWGASGNITGRGVQGYTPPPSQPSRPSPNKPTSPQKLEGKTGEGRNVKVTGS